MNIVSKNSFKMKAILKFLLKIPIINRSWATIYKWLGVNLGENARISPYISLYGDYKFLNCGNNSEINPECMFIARAPISIGNNSTIAYRVMLLTSANPNTPYNKLGILYPSKQKPITIKDNVWIGAGAIILPGVVIGECSVVAAGAVVNKNVPPYCVVAGCPAKIIKYLNSLK